MVKEAKWVIITYNGIDGACAAAMVLLRYPGAQLFVTSASQIDQTLLNLVHVKPPMKEVHVCGVGAWCPWESLAQAAGTLQQKNITLTWHCGRGYLQHQHEAFTQICRAAFPAVGSNTAAVCQTLGLDQSQPIPARLLALAALDPQLRTEKSVLRPEESFWLDLIDASISQYFKFQDGDRYRQTIQRLAQGRAEKEDEQLVKIFRRSGIRYLIHGKSPGISRLKREIKAIAAIDEPVIIAGETGTGKEHVAHLIHEAGSRADGPFVAINCAMFAGNTALANSQLFGHVKGAFTDAVKDRKGLFLKAQGGILYLDELCHLPIEIQAKLLRVTEDGIIDPEGTDQSEKVNVRLLAGSNRDLPALIRQGKFLPDLYHRLATLRIRVPSLRERPEDIDALVERTLSQLAAQGYVSRIKKKDWAELRSYEWPGNVRQLIKLVRRAVYLEMSVGEALAEERALGSLAPPPGDGAAAERCPLWPMTSQEIVSMEQVRKLYARRALALFQNNQAATRRALGISHPSSLNKLIQGE